MNTVKNNIQPSFPKNLILNDVCHSGETAFIGKCGYGPENALYLISYGHIVLASNPLHQTWSSYGCIVVVERYVDIEINVMEK